MFVTDLEVYKKLCDLHLEVHELSLQFPKFELFELGSQIRRSSNSIPANLAEGFGNKHTDIYLECISRAQGELRETKHHLLVAYRKNYMPNEKYLILHTRYGECSKMLFGLERALYKNKK